MTPPPMMRLAAALAACTSLSLSCFAFVVVPTGPPLASCSSVHRKVGSQGAGIQPLSRGRRRCNNSCNGRDLPAPRRMIVLQAAAGGSEQVRDREQQQERQPTEEEREVARSKQLNVACNDVVRTILDGNPTNEKERAEALRQRLMAQKDDLVSPGDDMSALFFDNLLLVCQHELHPDIGILRGSYGKAWHTILHYIEDAGWQLTDPPFSISG